MIYFAQAIRERRTYTDFMIGLIMLTQYYKDHDKSFFIKGDIVDVFKNEKCVFNNIEENNSYKLLRDLRLKAVAGIREDPMHRDDTFIKKLFIERVTRNKNINDMYLNNSLEDINFLLDNTVKFYYLNNYNNSDLHCDDNTSKKKTASSIKVNVNTINSSDIADKFTDDMYFINLPTFRIDQEEDLKMLDIFCSFLVNETPYKKLILISGSNDYKNHFCNKFSMETTHFYDDGFTSKKLGFRKTEAGFTHKEKGSLQSLLTDCFYIQDSPAGYIDFMQTYNTYRDELFKYGMSKYSESYYDTFITRNKSQAIDIVGKELKLNKVYYQ
tara:strand:+ start:2521 stop:3501 length:981 start_codon:yes stop_codon:yes gene_type:complete